MPTLDDAPILSKATAVAADDLIQVYDVSTQPEGSKPIEAGNLFASIPTTLSSAQQIALISALVNELPTNASGLSAGELYLNTGVLTVVQA